MNKFLSLLAVAGVVAISSSAFAEDKVATPVQAPAHAMPAKTVEPAKSVELAKEAAKPISAELQDGSKIEIATDSTVSVIEKDGSKTAAPDGVHTLKDGVTFTVKNGKRVVQ
ncbi:MAG: hypothetical protein WCL30_07160 [Pseudomonadota bacterium]